MEVPDFFLRSFHHRLYTLSVPRFNFYLLLNSFLKGDGPRQNGDVKSDFMKKIGTSAREIQLDPFAILCFF